VPVLIAIAHLHVLNDRLLDGGDDEDLCSFRSGQYERAAVLYRQMQDDGLKPNQFTAQVGTSFMAKNWGAVYSLFFFFEESRGRAISDWRL
jgi:pentatricopeptide repeat protein